MKKIEIIKKEVADQEALKFKNFEKVLDKYTAMKPPFYKSPFFATGAVGVVILCAYLMLSPSSNEPKEAMINPAYNATYNSPIGDAVEYEHFESFVDSENAIIISSESGTKISIPAKTLVDSLGNYISGEVTFKYREFLDQKDVFLSGIPMKYDSSGVETNFESAGMFEMLAYQNDQPIFVAPEKSVVVELASKEIGDQFNLYYYSPEEEKWLFKEKDPSGFSQEEISAVDSELQKSDEYQKLEAAQNEKSIISVQLKNIKADKPLRPMQASATAIAFKIDVDYSDFPELKSLKGLKFQVSPKEKNFNAEYAQEIWDDVHVNNGNSKREYKVCFTNKKHGEVCFTTNPVFAKKDIKNAEDVYENLLEEYKLKKEVIKKKKASLRKEIAKRKNDLEERRIVELNRRSVMLSSGLENAVTRTFQVNNFGIWNADYPSKIPTGAIVKGNFIDDNNNELHLGSIFLVLKERNIVISLDPQSVKKGIQYNPNDECMLWAVTRDRRNVAVYSAQKFAEIKENTMNFTFNMKLIDAQEFATFSTETIVNL